MKETEDERLARWHRAYEHMVAGIRRRKRKRSLLVRVLRAVRWVERERRRRAAFENFYGSNWSGPTGTSWGKYGER
jgi:hypothetical protein